MAKSLTKLSVSKARKQWAATINKSWKNALDAAKHAVKAGVETGNHLIKAKADLEYGEFMKMVGEDLAFSQQKANDLMKIASSPQISDSHHGVNLPDGWTVLRKLADLREQDFEWASKRGLINKGMTRGSAIAIRRARETKEPVIAINKGERGPTPDEARKIAKETGRLIAASDGRLYSGVSEEAAAEYADRRNLAYPIKDAINLIADCPVSAQQWVEQAEEHWLHSFRLGAIDDAINWLTALKPLMRKRQKVVDQGADRAQQTA